MKDSRLGLSDVETLEQVRENPYLQYFCGFERYQYTAAFAPTLFVKRRERLGPNRFAAFGQAIIDRVEQARPRPVTESMPDAPGDPDDAPTTSGQGLILSAGGVTPAGTGAQPAEPAPRGHLAVDASVAGSCSICSEIWGISIGGSTRGRHTTPAVPVSAGVSPPALAVGLREVARQQGDLHRHRARRIDDRIVSLHQPHVGPVMRDRLAHPIEFGAKFSVALIDGIACVDTRRWDAFHEAGNLVAQCHAYRTRYGAYLAKVLADGVYGTRANRR